MGSPVAFFVIEEPMKISLNDSCFFEDSNCNFEKIRKSQKNIQASERLYEKNYRKEQIFKCENCGSIVSTEREAAGVNNRNHCPICLWSKHVDKFKAGDRKSACKAKMQPIGLTVKKIQKNASKL